jgi:hypothetical protein
VGGWKRNERGEHEVCPAAALVLFSLLYFSYS